MKFDMTRHIRESNLIEGIDDIAADRQSMLAWEYLIKKVGLSHYTIKQLQKKIVETQGTLSADQRGKYRTVWVRVGRFPCPDPKSIPLRMGKWMINYPERSPKQNHIDFEHIHPFVDGNGRTGRMLMWWQEIKMGREPTLLLNREKGVYYEWFK